MHAALPLGAKECIVGKALISSWQGVLAQTVPPCPTHRPVFSTDAATVSTSHGKSVRKSMTSAEMPCLEASVSAWIEHGRSVGGW